MYQCFAILKEKKRFTAIRRLDVQLGGVPSHYEVQKKSHPYQAMQYCKKGDQPKAEWNELGDKGPNFGLNANFTEHGTPPKKPKEPSPSSLAYAEAFKVETTFDEAIDLIKQAAPRDFALHGESIMRNLALAKVKPFQHKYFMEDFLRGPLPLPEKKSILIYGPSGVGKTHFALAHFKKPLIVSDMDDLKKFNPAQQDGIVFDDCSFTHIPPEKVIHLVDRELDRSIRCRHSNATLPAGTVKIFTHNTANPFYKLDGPYAATQEQQNAISRRVDCWHVPSALFKHAEHPLVGVTRYALNGPIKPALRREQERIFVQDGVYENVQ